MTAFIKKGMIAGNKDEIELPDVEPEAFLALLKFLYTDDVSIGPEIVITTLYTGIVWSTCSVSH